jgi:type I restriction enzyme, S subunit
VRLAVCGGNGLPPISEQSRIATFRDKADELRAKRKRTLEMLNNLAATIFAEMFGNPIRNEKGWKVVSVGDFVARFEGGKNVAAEDEDAPVYN